MISNEPLQELQVEPAPELEADFVQMADYLETEALVQADGDRIVRVDAARS